MEARLNSDLGLNGLNNLAAESSYPTPGIPGNLGVRLCTKAYETNINELRPKNCHTLHAVIEILQALYGLATCTEWMEMYLSGLWREKLEARESATETGSKRTLL